MAEKDAEKRLKKMMKAVGGFSRKWVSPGHASVQDRICFFPNSEVWFIEMKRKGKLPTDAQWREIFKQRALGHNAGYLAGEDEVNSFISSDDRVRWMNKQIRENYDFRADFL
jgi:hypothetical protein